MKKSTAIPQVRILLVLRPTRRHTVFRTCMGRMATQPVWVSWKTAKWYKCWHGTTRTQVSICWRRTNRGELQWIVLDEGESLQVYDLNDGQVHYRPAFVNESSQYASTGCGNAAARWEGIRHPRQHGCPLDFWIRSPTPPRTAPPTFPGCPGNDVHGQININRKGEYPMKKSHRLPAGLPWPLQPAGYRMCQRRPPSPIPPVETPAPTTASTAPVEEPAASSEPAPESTPAQGEQMPAALTRRRRNPSLHRIPKRWAVSLIRPCKAQKELPQDYYLSFFLLYQTFEKQGRRQYLYTK